MLSALGNLPDAGKAPFIREALRVLETFRVAQTFRRPILPKADRLALARVAKQTEHLILAMNRAQETETGTSLLRDAWLSLNDSSGETLANPMPSLERLREAAALCLPEKKSASNRAGQSPASATVISTLADHYLHYFKQAPTFGRTSAFVGFIREALPVYGLSVPAMAEIRNIAARG